MDQAQAQTTGIKEVTDVIKALAELGCAMKKVMADGKVGVSDFGVLVAEIEKASLFTEAVKGAGQIPAEIKNLDAQEAQALVAEVLKAVAQFKAA